MSGIKCSSRAESENDYWVLYDKQHEREGLSWSLAECVKSTQNISSTRRLPLGKDRGSTFFLISPGGYHTSQSWRYFWKHPVCCACGCCPLIHSPVDLRSLLGLSLISRPGLKPSPLSVLIRSHFNVEKCIINVSGRQYQSLTWQINFQDKVGHKYLSSVISVCTSACGLLRGQKLHCDTITTRTLEYYPVYSNFRHRRLS